MKSAVYSFFFIRYRIDTTVSCIYVDLSRAKLIKDILREKLVCSFDTRCSILTTSLSIRLDSPQISAKSNFATLFGTEIRFFAVTICNIFFLVQYTSTTHKRKKHHN